MQEIKIKPDPSIVSKRIYANFANVSRTPFDYTIKFCDVPPIDDYESIKKNDHFLNVPIVAEIAIPKEMVQGLIDALKNQLEESNKDETKIKPKKAK